MSRLFDARHRAYIFPLLLLIPGLLVGLWGCRGGERIGEPERPLSEYGAFPADHSGAPDGSDQEALKVTMSRPKDELNRQAVISVAFNKPMVEAGIGARPEDTPIFEITPPVAGEFSWVGARTAVFHPDKPFALADEYTVRVPAGITSQDGSQLERDFSFDFHTPYLQIWVDADNPKLQPGDKIELITSLPVELEALKDALTMSQNGRELALEIAQSDDPSSMSTTPNSAGARFLIRPHQDFSFSSTYHLHIDGGLRAINASRTLGEGIKNGRISTKKERHDRFKQAYRSDGFSASLESYGAFEAERINCGWGEECTANSPWRVYLSNPVDKESADKCVQTSPRIELETSASGEVLTLYPRGAKQGQIYNISIHKACRDIFGNSLANPRTFKQRVGYNSPSLRMTTGLTLIEKQPGEPLPSLPMRVENLQQPATAHFYTVPADKLGWLAAHLDDEPRADQLQRTLGMPHTKTFGADLPRGQSKVYQLELSQFLKDKRGAVFIDIYAPDLVTRWFDGHYRALVSVSDLGLSVKQSSDQALFWVTKLSDGAPAKDVKIELLDNQGAPIWQGSSDARGLLSAPSRDALQAEHDGEIQLVSATLAGDTTLLRLDDWHTQVGLYQFDLPYSAPITRPELRTFIFSERGVYRPGDTLHIKGFARLSRGGTLSDYPDKKLRLELTDSLGNRVHTARVTLSDYGGFELDLALPEDAPLGTWDIRALPDKSAQNHELADAYYDYNSHGTFRVEAYRAPEFEVNISPDQDAYIVGSRAKFAVEGRYLFGAAMQNESLKWVAQREYSTFSAPDFPDFSFHPDAPNHWYYDDSTGRTLGEESTELGPNGALDIELNLPEDKDFIGAQRVNIEASVRDLSHQEISAHASITLHPGEFYVGVKQRDYLVESGSTIRPAAVAVDHSGRAIAGKKLEMRLLRREWSSERKKDASGQHQWESVAVDTAVDSCQITSKTTPSSCDFKLDETGSYRVIVDAKDAQGRSLQSADSFYVWGAGATSWASNNGDSIELIADKEAYEVGDTARLMVQSPFDSAKALVTIEKGRILEQYISDIKGNSATLEVPITQEMKPNAFVSISLVRGRAALKADAGDNTPDPGRPQFKIGYAQLSVDHSDKTLQVDIETDKENYRPQEQVEATINLADYKGNPIPGEVTFMAVDQGVLSLTGYQTPDPIAYFYAPQPIIVEHADTRLALITRADLERQSSAMKSEFGGGGGATENYRNKFATAAAFKARVPVGADGRARVKFEAPDNLTAYRLMAVAASDAQRFGRAEARIQVNKPLMIRPALPRFAATGDTFQARAIIQSMSDLEGAVEVELSVDGALTLDGQSKKSVTLKKGANQAVAFSVKAKDPGPATLRFKARSARQDELTDAVEITLPVRYPAAGQTYAETGILSEEESWASPKLERRIELPDTMHPGVGGLEITLSSTRLAELMPGLEFLLDYPYSCSEQIASQLLPLISLSELAEPLEAAGLMSTQALHKKSQRAINTLLSRQLYDGGIPYWPDQSSSHPWVSAYTAWILGQAAQQKGYKINEDQYEYLLNYLKNLLRQSLPEDKREASAALATRALAVLALAEADSAEPAYHDELYRKRQQMPRYARLLLAAAMHRADSTADYRDELLDSALSALERDPTGDGGGAAWLPEEKTTPYSWTIWESPLRQDAIALLTLTQTRPEDPLLPQLAQGLMRRRMNGYWSNTQDTAFALHALGGYFALSGEADADYEVIVATGQDIVARELFEGLDLNPRRVSIPMATLDKYKGQLLTIMRSGEGGPLYYSTKLNYAPKEPPEQALDGGFSVQREYVMAEGPEKDKPATSAQPGDVLRVQLSIAVPEKTYYLAVEDPLPAGFEPINTSFETTSRALTERALDAHFISSNYWWSYGQMSFDYSAQHDDRVELFRSEVPAGIYRHAYLIRATTPGEFSAPAARVEAMYDPVVFGQTKAERVRVEP